MKIIEKHLKHLIGFLGFGLAIFLPSKTFAFCPICVVSTGALAGVFRWLGVDDVIIGLWLGGFVSSLVVVLNNFLVKKQKRFKFQLPLLFIGFYILAIAGLYWGGVFAPYNKILGINKMIFGIIFGNLLLLFAFYFDKFLRRQNQGKIFVSHQKVIIAIVFLLIFSFVFYPITK